MTVAIMMLVLGLLAHYLKELTRIAGETKRSPNLLGYWTSYWPQTLLCVVSAIAGFVALHEATQLTPVTAFGVGYMANSVADIMGKRGTEKF
jgi:hypothetical protein